MINKERILSTFCKLIEIDAVSFKEHAVADFVEPILVGLGFEVIRQSYDKSFNLIAYKRGTCNVEPLMLSAHMDTVATTKDITYEVRSDRVVSIGNTILGADDRSAIAQILEALMIITENNLTHPDIEIVLTSAEEVGLVGAKHLDFGLLKSKRALVLDCSGSIGSIVTSAPTHVVYEIAITGRSAHAGLEPEKGINAIKVASRIVDALPDGRLDALTTANVGKISGGTATNIVPDSALIVGEYRSHDPKTLVSIKQIILDTATTLAQKHNAQMQIHETTQYMAFSLPDENAFLKLVDEALRQLNITPKHILTNGGSDASIFNEHGIVTLNLSNGMQDVHTNNEFILLDDLYKGSELIVKIIQNAAKAHND